MLSVGLLFACPFLCRAAEAGCNHELSGASSGPRDDVSPSSLLVPMMEFAASVRATETGEFRGTDLASPDPLPSWDGQSLSLLPSPRVSVTQYLALEGPPVGLAAFGDVPGTRIPSELPLLIAPLHARSRLARSSVSTPPSGLFSDCLPPSSHILPSVLAGHRGRQARHLFRAKGPPVKRILIGVGAALIGVTVISLGLAVLRPTLCPPGPGRKASPHRLRPFSSARSTACRKNSARSATRN